MGAEYSSGIKFDKGDRIKGYEIVNVFEPGSMAFSGKAKAPNGRPVFFKKYVCPGGSSPWLAGFVSYQSELKQKIQGNPASKGLCYEFIEFFEMSKTGGMVPLRAFYQVFEWVEGGSDLRKMLDTAKANPSSYSWSQKVTFARVMMAGVNAIHRSGVIHTDLKPNNLYLIPDTSLGAKYKLRIIDMDFSLLDGKKAPWDGHEGYVGTPGYMSPEHLLKKVPTKASDTFTCGLMLGELLGGAHPAAPLMDSYEEQVKEGRLKSINIAQPIEGVTDLAFLNHVINGCLRLEPSKRPTPEEVLRALNGQLAEWDGKRPSGSVPPKLLPDPPPPPPPPPPPSPSPPPPPPPPPSPTLSGSRVSLSGATGKSIVANIGAVFGKATFSAWGPEYEKFFSTEQFRLFKDGTGFWMIEHCIPATNITNVNGVKVTSPTVLESGAVVTVGVSQKCPITLTLIS